MTVKVSEKLKEEVEKMKKLLEAQRKVTKLLGKVKR